MRTLLAHPSGLMYSEIFLRLEPLGAERVAAAARAGGHEVRLCDLQVFRRADLATQLRQFAPGRSYRKASPEAAAAEVAALAEPNVFIVDDVAFIRPEHGHAIAAELERRQVRKKYYLETRSDAVLPTTLPLPVFYRELVKTQAVINSKHLGAAALAKTARLTARLALHGQTNFLRMLWRFNRVYNPARQYADHQRTVRYQLPATPPAPPKSRTDLYIHTRPRHPAASARRDG